MREVLYIKIILILMISLGGCAINQFVKKVDNNANGAYEKFIYFKNDVIIKEEYDIDENFKIDRIVYYNKNNDVFAIEQDTDNDGLLDSRDEFFEDYRTKSFRDLNKDGFMDRSWITYYTEFGEKQYVEYDIDNDGKIDSNFKFNKGIRENFVNGAWISDVMKENKHGILIEGQWQEIIFKEGEWSIQL